MMGSQPEVTARIDRNELLRLLATMRTADTAPPVPRKHPRPSSEVAALLPPRQPIRRPRITCAMPIVRPTPPTGTPVVAAPTPVQPVQPVATKPPEPSKRTTSLLAAIIERFAGFVLDGLC